MDLLSLRIDYVDGQHVVAGKTIGPGEIAVAAAENVAGHADRGAAAAGKCQTASRNGFVDLAERGAGAYRCGLCRLVDRDRIEQARVDDDARALRKPLVGGPTAAQRERQIVAATPT